MLIVIDHNSRIPIYEQIKTQIIALINSGVLAPGDKLPSLRALASDLSLNFNTIKKVFALLEADGVIESRQGAGFFVTAGAVENKNILAKAEEELSAAQLAETISHFLRMQDEKHRKVFVRRYWYGDSVGRIAELFGMNEKTVATYLFRTREKLRVYLRKEGYDHE